MSKKYDWQGISSCINEIFGLSYPVNRWPDLQRGLLAAAAEPGMGDSLNSLTAKILSRNLSRKELDIIAGQLTVGETYFFREKAALHAFKSQLIPELLAERYGKDQQISIWCAGCCSGEEPYTLAMILLETIPEIKNWKIDILGTDINPFFLKKAMDGLYNAWSFRETTPEIQAKYFKQQGGQWQLVEEVRKMVEFRQHNLAGEDFLTASAPLPNFDLIFCRNVLMYFEPILIQRIGLRFYQALNDYGWFITSPVEVNDERFEAFAKVNIGDCFLYRKIRRQIPHVQSTGETRKPPTIKTKIPVAQKMTINRMIPKPAKDNPAENQDILKPYEKAQQLYRKKSWAECLEVCLSWYEKEKDQTFLWLQLITRSYANMGWYAEAMKYAQLSISHDPFHAASYHLLASIHAEKQEYAEAVNKLRHALYLDHNCVLSNLLLADIYRRQDNRKGSLLHLNNAKSILAGQDARQILDETEGLTVGEIKSIIESF